MNTSRIVIAANWIPKYRRVRVRDAPSLHKIPEISKLKAARLAKVDAGEDAFFHCSTPRHLYLGVADGVGSWEKKGIDPSQFAWSLMNNCNKVIKLNRNSFEPSPKKDLLPLEVLEKAYQIVKIESSVKGSSTASILRICKATNLLESCNLGDSRFMVIRNRDTIVYKSPPQYHFFNAPYQLALANPESYDFISDTPDSAHLSQFQLQDNDLVVLATDGYFDNVFDDETIGLIQDELTQFATSNQNTVVESIKDISSPFLSSEGGEGYWETRMRKLSQKLAETARFHSINPKRNSPWTEYASRYLPCHEPGGKVDDITVLVAMVQKQLV